MVGNILIIISIIAYGYLFHLMSKPTPGGDYGVGYTFVWLIAAGGFVISTGLLAWDMKMNHCFNWMMTSLMPYRNWIVFFGWLAFVLATLWSLEYMSKWHEGEFPSFMRWLALSRICIWLPFLVFIPACFLLNTQHQPGSEPIWIKIPIQIAFVISLLIGFGILYSYINFSVQRRMAVIQEVQKSNEENENNSWSFNNSMDFINNYHDETILGLLSYTHREQDERLRKAAIAKIKSYHNWENELIDILNKGQLQDKYWVIAFLDENKIDHPENFIQPIRNSLEILVSGVQTSLKDPFSLNLGYINIEALCRSLETQFKSNAAEFKPGMLVLQNALSIAVPERNNNQNKQWFDKTLEASRSAVKNWLASNK